MGILNLFWRCYVIFLFGSLSPTKKVDTTLWWYFRGRGEGQQTTMTTGTAAGADVISAFAVDFAGTNSFLLSRKNTHATPPPELQASYYAGSPPWLEMNEGVTISARQAARGARVAAGGESGKFVSVVAPRLTRDPHNRASGAAAHPRPGPSSARAHRSGASRSSARGPWPGRTTAPRRAAPRRSSCSASAPTPSSRWSSRARGGPAGGVSECGGGVGQVA